MEISSSTSLPSTGSIAPRLGRTFDGQAVVNLSKSENESSTRNADDVTEVKGTAGASKKNLADQRLAPEEKKQVEQLKIRDREVRAHEQAHKAAAGSFAVGGPTFEFVTGPDGRQYAVGGEVNIDVSAVPNNPEATISKAQTVRRAALAPAEPSAQDRNVAAKAAELETKARQELKKERTEKTKEGTAPKPPTDDTEDIGGQKIESPTESKSAAENQNTPNLTAERQIRQFSQDIVSTSGQLLDLIL